MESSTVKAKKTLRNEILTARMCLSDQEVLLRSKVIFDKLTESDNFKKNSCIMTYIDFRKEVYTRDFIKKCLSIGKRIAIPMVIKEDDGKKSLWACEINDLDKDLEISSFGILEPRKELVKRMDPQELELVVVPGVAFDKEKYRLGYGAGYYDRFLKTMSEKCLYIGVAFELQVVDRVPREAHDVPLDAIITEIRVI